MFKFPCKINISKLVMFWLGLILCSNVMHTPMAIDTVVPGYR